MTTPRLRRERLVLFESVIADARAGRPRVLCVDGAAGMGKTSHLRAAVALATGFRVLEALGDPAAYRPPFGILEQLGVTRTAADDGTPHSPAVAAQTLRRLIDDESRGEPLAIVIDDAQWADTESLEALRLVLERVSGDQLLVLVASRPLGPSAHPLWQRHRNSSAVDALLLDGIDLAEAADIIRDAGAGAGAAADPEADLVEGLWRHTDRNPMHLRSLAREYTLGELAAMTELPAPVEMAHELNARLSSLDPDAGRLLRAVAVTGSSWIDRLDAAAIAELDDPSAALELLIENGLLIARPGALLADVRIVHALVRAAVYQSIPPADRRSMHRLAAEVLTSPMQRLEHEVAAAHQRDDALADRLEQMAKIAHAESDHRREAQLLQWASRMSTAVAERERRWLDAQLATVLARDTRSVRAHLSEVGWTGDAAHRAVVLGWLLIVENRVADARRVLEAPGPEAVATADPATRTRLLVLKAWTMLVSGYATERISAILGMLPEGPGDDPALRGFYLRTAGQIAGRELDFDHLRKDFEAVPLSAGETPMQDTDKLGWRGAIYSMCGFTGEARRDLSEVVSRIRGGRIDAGSGADHALYGFALWQGGEFDRAGIELQAATDLALDRLNPLVQAALPLVPAVRGDFDLADALIAQSEEALRDFPWREAISVLSQAQVARLHAGDDESARASYLARFRSRFGAEASSPHRADGAIWQLHMALARVWAGELDEVEAHLIALETDMIVPAWAEWSRPWILGLCAERAGDHEGAFRLLEGAASPPDTELPLYRAHVHADLARVAARHGEAETAMRAAAHAGELYARMGAAPYVARLSSGAAAPAPAPDLLRPLSDREREVAALLLAGFSYAQIAEELYVTRSTVAFHLGNIYAKTGVGSRHQLIQLARGGEHSAPVSRAEHS